MKSRIILFHYLHEIPRFILETAVHKPKGSHSLLKFSAHKNIWVCYLLECADGTLYCGITNDLGKRLTAHNAGEGAKYTRGRTPVRLVYREGCVDKSEALKCEMKIKSLSRAEKLELIRVPAKCQQMLDNA